MDLSKRLARIVDRMLEPIPEKAELAPRPAKSWRQLRPGQFLRDKSDEGPCSLWYVLAVDNKSATMVKCDESVMEGTFRVQRWTTPNWDAHFERARKPPQSSQEWVWVVNALANEISKKQGEK